MSLPSLAEVEHADWPSLQRMCESLGLNPKGRSAVVRMRVLDYVRRRTQAEPWSAGRGHIAVLLTRLGFPDLSEALWGSTMQLDAPAPWIGLGQAQLAGGYLNESAKSFDRALQMGDAAALLHRAEALAARGDYDRAVAACESYLAVRPGDVRALAMKADFLARGGFADEGARVLRAAAESLPESRGLWRAASIALLKAGHPDAALDAFRAAIGEDPTDMNVQINQGVAVLLAGQAREAIGAFRKVLEIDPERSEALNNLGVAYLKRGQTKSALANLERAAKLGGSPRILQNLAKVRKLVKAPSRAVQGKRRVAQRRKQGNRKLRKR